MRQTVPGRTFFTQMTRLVQVPGWNFLPICWGMGSVLTGKVLLDKARPLNHPLCSRLTEILVSQPPGEAGVCVCAGHGTVQEYLCPKKPTLHQGRRIKVLPWVLLHDKTQFSHRLCLAGGWKEAGWRFAAKQWPRLELLSHFGQDRTGNKAKACSCDWGLRVWTPSCSLGESFQNSEFFQAFENWASPISGGRAEQPW